MERRVNLSNRNSIISHIINIQISLVKIENIINDTNVEVNDEYINKLRNELEKISETNLINLYFLMRDIYDRRSQDFMNFKKNLEKNKEDKNSLANFLSNFINMFAAPLFRTTIKCEDFLNMYDNVSVSTLSDSKEELVQAAIGLYQKIVDYNYDNKIVVIKTPVQFLMKNFEDELSKLGKNSISKVISYLDLILIEMSVQYGMNCNSLIL
jgi:hypothetical protein